MPKDLTVFSPKLKIINLVLLGVVGASMIASGWFMGETKDKLGLNNQGLFDRLSPLSLFGGAGDGKIKLSGNLGEDAVKLAVVTGVPDKYGQELAVNFDQVQQSMNVMKQFDPGYGANKIVLTGEALKRYTDVGLRISCEYCCGAKAIVFANGEAACGCAHSQAMRGLAAYLIEKHGAEYTDDQILRELARWKGRYFPKQMSKKMTEQLQNGQYTPDMAALLLELEVPKYSGQSADAPLPSSIKDAPGMVGGC
ncbi:MAG: hypothetical protein A2921_00460 [Candidatus Magasanikbacteria bacterium RIFCSPLOWO2_01_FULL_43_20b]|uniref:Uncharacterized protein n=1 Tax=Candidatus Magasanikbacteria bacterium RIFCSPLOWO2_12_FULL_43_12 TaxID=1798692 RepID=A0A1F6MVM9_9BACT|nr:MAG: hypothetical protein A3I93_02715 [Candidatus Magasanikbacteria bacterium RIFCSPLOWO2_02_FULL_43_22]OGH72101.1 MAG: hypothetical protein A3C74_03980 [Candidatus Magasanikbacteria bacterium RIFCSPHIGHO2_02_FULL_44_13]OGH72886.1 MAG: hypothetical protein A2921_00460 [Candidatus Magasanikbacteria bacterium RIFCSPLOWO2_01_FULL_43_20b]OGH75682.1 MAG: hypothetical protein A3G00_04290 [Candidatus Magasanikbacteria bacterium RIFCSPLOWO2_12_FULL_43_12]